MKNAESLYVIKMKRIEGELLQYAEICQNLFKGLYIWTSNNILINIKLLIYSWLLIIVLITSYKHWMIFAIVYGIKLP